MKYVLLPALLVCSISLSTVFGQNPTRPNSIIAKKLWLDYNSPQGGTITDFGQFTDGFEIAYLRNLSPYINAVLPFKVGVIDLPDETNNRTLFGFDALLQLQHFKEDKTVIPYALIGLGTSLVESENMDFQVPLGIGINFRLRNFGFVNIQSEYRFSLNNDRNNLHHGIGLGFMIGKEVEEAVDTSAVIEFAPMDKDHDGIRDAEDDCPEMAGLAALGGCPDGDGDGIKDMEDICPDEYGPKASGGCPDSDGDGVANMNDDCPDVAGSLKGCPDSDGDGLADRDDRCPEKAGSPENGGCPQIDSDGDGVDDSLDECPTKAGQINGCPDSDKDGIADKDDKCPYAAGEGRFSGCPDSDGDGIDDSMDQCPNMSAPASPNGCPEIREEDREVLDYAIQAVQFESGSAQLKSSSFAVLEQVKDVLNKYPDYTLHIIGHTDNVGSEINNQSLSQRRAKSCYDYLASKGVPISRLSYGGFGESQPIADNDTEEGRSLNRRVEFDLILK